jgi:hypothetical protein
MWQRMKYGQGAHFPMRARSEEPRESFKVRLHVLAGHMKLFLLHGYPTTRPKTSLAGKKMPHGIRIQRLGVSVRDMGDDFGHRPWVFSRYPSVIGCTRSSCSSTDKSFWFVAMTPGPIDQDCVCNATELCVPRSNEEFAASANLHE